MGMPSRGAHGRLHNVGKEYVASWVTTMAPGIAYSTGHMRRRRKKAARTPATLWGPDERQRNHHEGGDHLAGRQHLQEEMYAPGPDGKERR